MIRWRYICIQNWCLKDIYSPNWECWFITSGISYLNKIIDWKNINDLIPSTFKSGLKYKRTGKAGIFAGSLELVKEGNLTIKQDNLFDEIYVKEIK